MPTPLPLLHALYSTFWSFIRPFCFWLAHSRGLCMQETSSFMSGSMANTSPMASSRHLLTRHQHSPACQTGDLWAMSPRESGLNRMDSHFSGPLYAQPMSNGHQHSAPAGLQPAPTAPQYQPARSTPTQNHVPSLSLMGMQARQSGDSMQLSGHCHRPLVGFSNTGSSHQGSPRVSLDAQNSSGVRRKGSRRSQRRHSSSAIYSAGFGDAHGGTQRSARMSRQSSNWDAVSFREPSGTGQGDYMYQAGMKCGPRATGDDSPAMSPRVPLPRLQHRNLAMLTEDFAEGHLLGAGCGTMPQSWNSVGAATPPRAAPDDVRCVSNITTGSPRMRDACTSLQCLSMRQMPNCGASMQHLYESGFLDHATPEAGLGRSCRLQGGSDGSDAYVDSFDGTPRDGALRSAPQAVSQFVGKIGD